MKAYKAYKLAINVSLFFCIYFVLSNYDGHDSLAKS